MESIVKQIEALEMSIAIARIGVNESWQQKAKWEFSLKVLDQLKTAILNGEMKDND